MPWYTEAGCRALLLSRVYWLLPRRVRRLLDTPLAACAHRIVADRQLCLLRELEPLAGYSHLCLLRPGLRDCPRTGGVHVIRAAQAAADDQPHRQPRPA